MFFVFIRLNILQNASDGFYLKCFDDSSLDWFHYILTDAEGVFCLS